MYLDKYLKSSDQSFYQVKILIKILSSKLQSSKITPDMMYLMEYLIKQFFGKWMRILVYYYFVNPTDERIPKALPKKSTKVVI